MLTEELLNEYLLKVKEHVQAQVQAKVDKLVKKEVDLLRAALESDSKTKFAKQSDQHKDGQLGKDGQLADSTAIAAVK